MRQKRPAIKTLKLPGSFVPSRDEFTPLIKITQDLFTAKSDDSSSDSFSISEDTLPKKKLIKNLSILGEMGFGKIVAPNSVMPLQFERKLSRRSSIGVSDFWSSNEKKKFLKGNGYWEAYKDMQKKDEALLLASKKVNRFPTLPHIMDLNTKKRILIRDSLINSSHSQTKIRKSTFFDEAIKSQQQHSMNLKISILDKITDRCKNLTNDNYKLKSSTDRFKKNFSKQCKNHLTKSKRKLSKHELRKIKLLVDSCI